MATFRILCIDGGGIRGIIPAILLAEIERRTRRPISQQFDLIAGTSTGGVLALGMVKPGNKGRPQYTAADLVQLYETQGRRIFSRSLIHQIISLDGLANKKYQSGPVEAVFEEFFGDVALSQALTNVMLTSYDIELREAFFFRSYRAKKEKDREYLMRDAARATSAAPTYFEPELIEPELKEKGEKPFALIDGGVFANNPSMCALVDAMNWFGQGLDNVLMVSLGTGSEVKRPLEFQRVRNWGVMGWARPILTIVFNGINDTVDFQSGKILKERYHRLQVEELPKSVFNLDNASASNIRSLKQRTEKFIATAGGEEAIAAICRALTVDKPKRKPSARARQPRPKPVAA